MPEKSASTRVLNNSSGRATVTTNSVSASPTRWTEELCSTEEISEGNESENEDQRAGERGHIASLARLAAQSNTASAGLP